MKKFISLLLIVSCFHITKAQDTIPSVAICTQVWMLNNLDVSTYRNGDPIPEVTDPTAWIALTTGAWCYYNNDPANGVTYGKLYNWYAVNDPRGLAPTGWHVPSDAEWTPLSTCLGGDAVAGGAMKETGTTHWISPNTGATNSSGFTGLPGGYRGGIGAFGYVGLSGDWWSSTESNTANAWWRNLNSTNGNILRYSNPKPYGFSVRCLRDLYSDTVTVKLIDPNPSLILTNGILNTNFSGLDTTNIVKGAATDGVTKVLLYCNSTSPIRFSIADTSNGTLSDLASQNTYSSNITIQPVNGKVIVVFNAPDGYGNNTNNQTTRQTSIKAVTLNSTDTTKINLNLITPPVVLVHGMWSGPNVWVEGGFKDSLVNRGFELPVLANYEASNSTTFNPNSPESGEGRSAVQNKIAAALLHYHNDLNIAATQVDVVGHSLGGLMARSYSQQTTFKDISNYNKGYIHKLITLCTPHRGSPLGPEMWNQRNAIVSFSGIPSPLSIAMWLAGYPIGSCHRDFAIQSDGIKALTQTLPFKTFSIEADYTGQTAGYIKMNILTVFATGKPIDLIMYSRCLTGGILTHDLVVPLSSQRGFLNDGKDFLFVNTAHSAPGNNTVTNSSDVLNKVAGLLLSNNKNDFGTGYPAPDSLPLDCTNASERNTAPKNSSDDKITTSQRTMGNQAIHITSPISGATYQEGSGVNITLAFTTSGGAIPTNSMFMVKDIGWFPATNTPPYTTSFILPQNSPIGNISVLVLAIDSTGLRMADSSHITITPTGTLDSISVDPGKIILDSVTRTSSIYVSGYYHNGGVKSFHDLTDSTTGTVYSSQHNNVFKVNANGYLTAKGPGTDSLVISNGGKTIKILVTVSSNFQQAVLFPNTIDFPVIADATVGDNPFGLSASASSGDNVTFSLVSGSAVISNGIMTLNGPGAITVKASQVGNVYFAPAADVLRTFCVKSVSAIISADTSSFCSSGTVTLTSNATSGNQWYKDGVALSGSSATNLKVTASGSYTVKVTVSGCESAASNSIVVTANSVPTLTLIRDTILLSSSALNYRWFFNNNTINGETTNSIRVRKTGFYRVETSPNKVCWTPSIDFPILILSDPLINDTLSMDVYPNPTPDNFNVVVRLQKVTNVTAYVTISNVSGSVVLQTNKLILFTNEVKIPVNLNMKGSFFVKVYINGDVKTMPVIIQ